MTRLRLRPSRVIVLPGIGIGIGILLATGALAHPLAPAGLELREVGDGEVSVRFKTSLYPRSRSAAERLAPQLPVDCGPARDGSVSLEGDGRVERFTVSCGKSLVGREVGVRGLRENGIDAVLRLELADGRIVQHALRAGRSSFRIPERAERARVFGSYLEMGALHILSGLDHVLFVLGLVLLVSRGGGYAARLILTLSAFTLGHCLTLSLAVLGFVELPTRGVEVAIALSVLALAVELGHPGPSRRRVTLPWILALGFGLLHGLGFAAALTEAGLPEGEIPLALIAFNVGIELGQVAFVGVVLALRTGLRVAGSDAWMPVWAYRLPVYAMGSLAAMWTLERTLALFR